MPKQNISDIFTKILNVAGSPLGLIATPKKKKDKKKDKKK